MRGYHLEGKEEHMVCAHGMCKKDMLPYAPCMVGIPTYYYIHNTT